ncbi:hypothetical protein LBW90_19535 [Pantoea rwandensis]|nr:hypothetical protein [Pantoea sp. alder69]MCA1252747.1 hypothetical protein [Pantoea sp. alder70]MCA1266190.1 hypothetical protein [Pantoea sp. alder81]
MNAVNGEMKWSMTTLHHPQWV